MINNVELDDLSVLGGWYSYNRSSRYFKAKPFNDLSEYFEVYVKRNINVTMTRLIKTTALPILLMLQHNDYVSPYYSNI